MADGAPRVTRREVGVVLFGYLLVSLWWLWPLPAVMATRVAYPDDLSVLLGADVDLMMWVLSWGAHATLTDPLGIFSANSFYPAPFSLAYSEHLFGQLPVFAPVYWLTGNPVLATNTLVVFWHVASAAGVYLFLRRFVGPPAACVGGFFFAFHPWRLTLLGHFYMLGVAYVPLAFLFTERLFETGRRRDAFGLFVCVALQLLSSFYLAYVFVLAYAVYLPIALWRWRESLDAGRMGGLLAALGAAAVPFLATSLPYLLLRGSGFLPSYASVDTSDFGAALSFSPYFAALAVLRHLGPGGIGPVGYGLAVVALLPLWRRLLWLRVTGAALFAVGFILAHGPEAVVVGHTIPSPYSLLQAWVPGFDTVRVPVRLLLVAFLGLAVLAALGFERLTSRASPMIARGAAMAVLLVATWSYDLAEVPVHERATGDRVPPAYRWLAANGEGGALLELPRAHPDRAAGRMYLSTFHWLPIVGGYSAYPSDFARYVYRLGARLPRQGAFERLTDVIDLDWILVHRDELKGDPARWNDLPDGLVRVAAFDEDLLIRVDRHPSSEVMKELVRSEATVTGIPRSPLRTCPGEIAIDAAPAEPWPRGQRIRLRLRVKNRGENGWPAVALNPRHLVRVSACMVAIEDERCIRATSPLPRDLPPGEELAFPVWVNTPPKGETARLEIELVQAGGGSLSDCGLGSISETVALGDAVTDSGTETQRR